MITWTCPIEKRNTIIRKCEKIWLTGDGRLEPSTAAKVTWSSLFIPIPCTDSRHPVASRNSLRAFICITVARSRQRLSSGFCCQVPARFFVQVQLFIDLRKIFLLKTIVARYKEFSPQLYASRLPGPDTGFVLSSGFCCQVPASFFRPS